jgi:hypothetical protein
VQPKATAAQRQQPMVYRERAGEPKEGNMAMERRLHPRERVICKAAVNYPPLGLVLGKIRDVSIGGMSIDTTPITLNLNTPVDITVRRLGSAKEGLARFHGIVVWTVDGRAGLMLSDDEAGEALHALRQLARRAPSDMPRRPSAQSAVPGS